MYKDLSQLDYNMSDAPNKPKRKYVRKTAKNTRNREPPYPYQTMEEYINAKMLRGETPTEEEYRKFAEELGFQDGVIPEPEELPLNIDEPELPVPVPAPTKKRCKRGTRKNKDGICVPNNPATVVVPVPAPTPAPELVPETIKEPTKKRCPRGTRKNKDGICVPNNPAAMVAPVPVRVPAPETVPEPIPETIPELVPEPIPELVPEPTRMILPEEPESDNKKRAAKTVINRFLDEKENLEREHPLKNHEYLYPDLNDPNFNIKIALKKEFRDAKYDGEIKDIEKQSNLLCNAKFELSPHQVFVKNFLSSDTPYKGLLLFHGLGTGKTCSAIGVAEEMRQYMKRTGLKHQILVVASPNVQGNFRQQL